MEDVSKLDLIDNEIEMLEEVSKDVEDESIGDAYEPVDVSIEGLKFNLEESLKTIIKLLGIEDSNVN